MNTDKVLLIPGKSDVERESVFHVWLKMGGHGIRIDKFWEPPKNLSDKKVALYGNDVFALVLAQILNVQLVTVNDSLIVQLEWKWIKREIQQKDIDNLISIDFPVFIKPVNPKQFPARVYETLTEFNVVSKGIESEKVIVSEIIKIEAEARAFIFEKTIKDIALYEGSTELNGGRLFLESFLRESKVELPKSYVVDLGYNKETDWFIIEFNSCWGAGLNNCQAEKIIECIIEATE